MLNFFGSYYCSFYCAGLFCLSFGIGIFNRKMSSDEQKNTISHLRIEQTDKELRNNALLCFDVSNNGYVAIGSESLPKKNISVYDEKGSFIYGYNFKSDGSFGVGWKNDFLVIYLVRENAAITINNNGDVLLCEEIKDTAETLPAHDPHEAYKYKIFFLPLLHMLPVLPCLTRHLHHEKDRDSQDKKQPSI